METKRKKSRGKRTYQAKRAGTAELIDLTSASPTNSRSPSVIVIQSDAEASEPPSRGHSRPTEATIVGEDGEAEEPPRKRRAVGPQPSEVPNTPQIAGPSSMRTNTTSSAAVAFTSATGPEQRNSLNLPPSQNAEPKGLSRRVKQKKRQKELARQAGMRDIGSIDKFEGAEELIWQDGSVPERSTAQEAGPSGSIRRDDVEVKAPVAFAQAGKGKERERVPATSAANGSVKRDAESDRESDRARGKMREWDQGKSWDRDEQERVEERERKKKKKSKGKGKGRQDDVPLFFLDDTPGSVPYMPDRPAFEASANGSGLLLPGHIKIITGEEADEAAVEEDLLQAPDSTSSGEEEEEVEGPTLVDFGALKGAGAKGSRYYEIAERNADSEYYVCEYCKETGHIANDCPHQVCFSCGAIDQHGTRECHAGTICFNCSKRGHTLRECTEPLKKGPRKTRCEKCGIATHRTLNCPSIWRVYTYYTPQEKRAVDAEARKSKANILEGGTMERGGPPYCSRCAGSGHWADDCPDWPPYEPTAFGWYNALSGPFGEVDAPSVDFSNTYKDDGAPLPDAPGKAAKAKEKKRQQQLAGRTEDEDAFERLQQSRGWGGRGGRGRRDDDRERDGRHMRFGPPSDSWRPPPPPLRARIGDHRDREEPWRRRDDYERDRYSRHEYADFRRGRDSDDDYYGPSRRQAPGQRYHGGYSR